MDLQTEGIEGTVVTFAGGSLHEAALVGLTAEVAGEWLVVTDRSPFHPVSLSWPDQPGDRGCPEPLSDWCRRSASRDRRVDPAKTG